jgi:hypothetical protein
MVRPGPAHGGLASQCQSSRGRPGRVVSPVRGAREHGAGGEPASRAWRSGAFLPPAAESFRAFLVET